MLRLFCLCSCLLVLMNCKLSVAEELAKQKSSPNIILIMADDLGYGDTGFNGHPIIETPHLDQLAQDGAVLTNFHSGGSVCSPTRGTFVTGRHPFRYGIFNANQGHLPQQEITLSEIASQHGYATGHFGKWHLGTLSTSISAKGPKRKPKENYSPPSWHGYDTSFVTESAVSTWDPTLGERAINNPFWLDGKAMDPALPNLRGSASRVVMDKALSFINDAAASAKPFLSVIWFHAPHVPVVAGPKTHQYYVDKGVDPQSAHYYGVVSEMDVEIGRLRKHLSQLGINHNTIISFTSDNGPEGKVKKGLHAGDTGGFRGRKRALFEGGVRVPSLFYWPGVVPSHTINNKPMSTLDYLPTVADILNHSLPDDLPLDGESLLPLFKGEPRQQPIVFRHRDLMSLIDGNYKFFMKVYDLPTDAQGVLYDLSSDSKESTNLASQHKARVKHYKAFLTAKHASFEQSHFGNDYDDPTYKPYRKWLPDDFYQKQTISKQKKKQNARPGK